MATDISKQDIAIRKRPIVSLRNIIEIYSIRCALRNSTLFIADCVYRIEAGGLHRRINPENQPHTDRNEKSKCDRTCGYDGRPSSQPGDHTRQDEAKDDTHRSASERDRGGFDDKLSNDVRLLCTHCAAKTNLSCALKDTGQHNVHDSDTSNEQRDGRDRDHDGIEQTLRALLLGEKFGGNNDTKVACPMMRGSENGADHLCRCRHVDVLSQVEIDTINVIPHFAVAVFQAKDGRLEGNIDDVVGVFSGHSRHLGLRAELRTHDPDHAEPLLIHLYVLTDGICGSKQVEPGGNAQYA